MSDPIREFIDAQIVVYGDDEIERRRDLKKRARAALYAEREAHAEAKDYKLLYQSGPRCECADDEACGHVKRAEKAEQEVANLRQRIAELEAQLRDSQT